MNSLEILNAATEKLRASEHYLEMREKMLGMPLAPYEKLFLDILDPICQAFEHEMTELDSDDEPNPLIVDIARAAIDWETIEKPKYELPEWIQNNLDRLTIRKGE